MTICKSSNNSQQHLDILTFLRDGISFTFSLHTRNYFALVPLPRCPLCSIMQNISHIVNLSRFSLHCEVHLQTAKARAVTYTMMKSMIKHDKSDTVVAFSASAIVAL